jgi:hypothetical protein
MKGLTEVLSGYQTKQTELNLRQSTYQTEIDELTTRLTAVTHLLGEAETESSQVSESYHSTLSDGLKNATQGLQARNAVFLSGNMSQDPSVLQGDQNVINFYEANHDDISITEPLQKRYELAVQRQEQSSYIEAGVIIERNQGSAVMYVTIPNGTDGSGLIKNLKEASLNALVLSNNIDFSQVVNASFGVQVTGDVDELVKYLRMQQPAGFAEAKVNYTVIDLGLPQPVSEQEKVESVELVVSGQTTPPQDLDEKVSKDPTQSKGDDLWMTRDQVRSFYGASYSSLCKKIEQNHLNLLVEKGEPIGRFFSVKINRQSLLRVLKELDSSFEVYSFSRAAKEMNDFGNSFLNETQTEDFYKNVLTQIHESNPILYQRASGRYQISNHTLDVVCRNYFARVAVEGLVEKEQVQVVYSKAAKILSSTEDAVKKMIKRKALKKSNPGVSVTSLHEFITNNSCDKHKRWTPLSRQ